jgi:hypothetical protein
MQTLYFEMAKQCCLEKKGCFTSDWENWYLHNYISAIMPPEKLQVDRITNLPNHTPARINKRKHSFHPYRLCYILHECYIIETCSDKLLQLGTKCSHGLPHPTIYGSWLFIDCWILTAARKLLLLSSPTCIVSFVSKLKFQSSKEKEKRRTVWYSKPGKRKT